MPLALLALAAWPRPASLAACVFAAGFVLNSFGGMKGLHYLVYALPFLFALWGMGPWPPSGGRPRTGGPPSATGWPPTGGSSRAGCRRARAPRLTRAWWSSSAVANPAWVETAAQLAEVRLPGEEPAPDWAAARPALEPWLKRVPVVVTTEELGTLYFLGRLRHPLQPLEAGRDRGPGPELRRVGEGGGREFAPDWRTGRAVISTVGSLGQVFDCYQEGLFLLASRQWGHAHLFSPEVQAFIRDHAQPVPLPGRSEVTAYGWSHPDGYRPPATCAALPPMPGPAARTRVH